MYKNAVDKNKIRQRIKAKTTLSYQSAAKDYNNEQFSLYFYGHTDRIKSLENKIKKS